jgi:hypothetical protein
MLYDLSAGKKICIPASSLEEAETLYEIIKEKFPSLSVRFYSSKTPIMEKKEHFSNVSMWWVCDVLIYTPTVSAGISFELDHFDKIYAYFSDKSCSVETTMQMLGRVRSLRDKTYVCCLGLTPGAVESPTTLETISRALYYNQREALFKTWAHHIRNQ